MTSALNVALEYISKNWNPVPVGFRSKVPLGAEWEKRIIDAATAPRFFYDPLNVGVILGPSSKGLTDVDLDCAEAAAIAPYLLPPTPAIFGRASKRASHWLYQTDLADRIEQAGLKFTGPDQKTLLELRVGGGGKGAQTVFPGSTHESGEPITWEGSFGEPAQIAGDLLQRRVQLIAAGCLIVRAWPDQGGRHFAALTVGSFLARAGLSETEIMLMIEAITRAANDEEWRDRVRAVKDAAKRVAATDQGAGLPKLAELVGDKAARKIAEWLGYQERRWTFTGYQTRPGQAAPEQSQPGARSQPAQPQPTSEPERPQPQPELPWPELAPHALHGLAGEVVRELSPHTESDPVALLLQYLTYFGNAIGRGPYSLSKVIGTSPTFLTCWSVKPVRHARAPVPAVSGRFLRSPTRNGSITVCREACQPVKA